MDLRLHWSYAMCLTAIGWPGVTIKVDTVYKGCPITFFDNLYLSCTYNFPLQHTVLELHYDQLGKHTTFTLWIAGFLIESLGDKQVLYFTFFRLLSCSGLRLLFNMVILDTAAARLPEFNGYKGRRYPGQ